MLTEILFAAMLYAPTDTVTIQDRIARKALKGKPDSALVEKVNQYDALPFKLESCNTIYFDEEPPFGVSNCKTPDDEENILLLHEVLNDSTGAFSVAGYRTKSGDVFCFQDLGFGKLQNPSVDVCRIGYLLREEFVARNLFGE